jgi:hypothetical protein
MVGARHYRLASLTSHAAAKPALILPKNDGGTPINLFQTTARAVRSLALRCSPLTEIAVGGGTNICRCRAIIFGHLRSSGPAPTAANAHGCWNNNKWMGWGGGRGRQTFAIRGVWWKKGCLRSSVPQKILLLRRRKITEVVGCPFEAAHL